VPTDFHRLVDRAWDRLKDQGLTVHYISRCHIASYCPICVYGTVSIRFIESEPPRIRIEGGGCTAGCEARDIARRLA
jgi:hypothetical protein